MNTYLESSLLRIFLFSSFFLGGFIVGPFSVRIYVTLLILTVLFLKGYKYPFKKEIGLYVLFILSYLFALFANGEIAEIDFAKYFFGRYFVRFVSFIAVIRLIKSKESFISIIKFICFLGVLNGVISILQYFGNSFAISLSTFFNPVHAIEGNLEYLDRFIEGSADGVGAFGVFHSNVANGYFAIIPCVLLLL